MSNQLPGDNNARGIRRRGDLSGLCRLIPINDSGVRQIHDIIEIVCRDLSTTAISFSHEVTLLSKQAVVVMPGWRGEALELEVEVVSSKRLGTGVYETGCKLVRKLPTQPH